jgi:hypothetical protein
VLPDSTLTTFLFLATLSFWVVKKSGGKRDSKKKKVPVYNSEVKMRV